MSDSEVEAPRKRLIPASSRGRARSEAGFHERRRAPRPRLAEIRRGASLKLLPPITDKPMADWDHVKKWLFDKIAAQAKGPYGAC